MRRAKKKNIRAYILWKISSLNWYVMADAVIEMVLKQKMVLTRLFCSWEESPIVCYLSHKTALKFHRCSRTLNCLCAASPEVVTLTCCIWSEFVFVCLFFFLMFFFFFVFGRLVLCTWDFWHWLLMGGDSYPPLLYAISHLSETPKTRSQAWWMRDRSAFTMF